MPSLSAPSPSNPGRRRSRLLLFVLVAVAVGWAVLALQRGGTPRVELSSDAPGIGRRPALVKVRITEPSQGIARFRLEALQGDRVEVLDEEELEARPRWAFWRSFIGSRDFELPVGRDTVPGLLAGDLRLRLTATGAPSLFGEGASATTELELPVRLNPPSIAVLSTQHNVAQGGSGVVVYRVGDEALAAGGRDGVQAGDWFFQGRPLPGSTGGERFALFGVPYTTGDAALVRLVAADPLGNEATASFVDRFFARPPAQDRIELADRFLAKVVPEILAQTPEIPASGDLLADYLRINGELRRRNAATLVELASKSQAQFLWRGPFRQMPNSQVTSRFADHRTYVYAEREVDRQDHLGYDLATREHDAVPASNRGAVVLARYFGIYGNTVVLDHGFGLQSLYSHLSSISVAEGQTVEAGQELGRTGQTGLAGGDHLHFTLMIGGLPVEPVEWWDEKWLRERLLPKLGAAAAAVAADGG